MKRAILAVSVVITIIPVYSQKYVDVAEEWSVDHTYGEATSGAGVSMVDFNNDGLDDLTLATKAGEKIHFYLNNGNDFQQVDLKIDDITEAKHVIWVDYDNDGDQDLYVSSIDDKNSLYQNIGDLNFRDVTRSSGLPEFPIYSWGVAWADYDKDGWIDLYVTTRGSGRDEGRYNFLFKNHKGHFEEVTTEANAKDSDKMPFCASFFDFNNDGWEDIYIVHDFDFRSVLLKNNGDGTFNDVSEESRSDLKIGGMGIAVGDFDNDGFYDIYNSNETQGNKLLKNLGNGTFIEISESMGVQFNGWGWAVTFFDYDNDADLDLYCTGGNIDHDWLNFNAFYRNEDFQTFTIPKDIGLIGDTVLSYTHAIGDFNNDGFYDIVSNNHFPNKSHLWKNSGNKNNWIKVKLVGSISNRDATGSQIEYFIDGESHLRYLHAGEGFVSQNSRTQIIGIGDQMEVDSLYVKWPSGHIDKIYNISANTVLTINEGEYSPFSANIRLINGSCYSFPKLISGLYGDNISHIWSTGVSSKSIPVVESGEYTLQTNTPFGVFYDTIFVDLEGLTTPLELEIHNYPSSAFDGYAVVEIDGGVPPYTIVWDDPFHQTTDTAYNLAPGIYNVRVKDQDGCTMVRTVRIDKILKIKNEIKEAALLYPVPTEDILKLDIDSRLIYKISVMDFSGIIKDIFPKETFNGEIDVKYLSPGSYFLNIQLRDNTSQIARFIKND